MSCMRDPDRSWMGPDGSGWVRMGPNGSGVGLVMWSHWFKIGLYVTVIICIDDLTEYTYVCHRWKYFTDRSGPELIRSSIDPDRWYGSVWVWVRNISGVGLVISSHLFRIENRSVHDCDNMWSSNRIWFLFWSTPVLNWSGSVRMGPDGSGMGPEWVSYIDQIYLGSVCT